MEIKTHNHQYYTFYIDNYTRTRMHVVGKKNYQLLRVVTSGRGEKNGNKVRLKEKKDWKTLKDWSHFLEAKLSLRNSLLGIWSEIKVNFTNSVGEGAMQKVASPN